jgi:hypothetical protein
MQENRGLDSKKQVSIWKDQDSLRHFVMAEPHATAIKKFTEWAEEGSAFV